MSRLTSDYHALVSRAKGEMGLKKQPRPFASPGLLIGGLVLIGIGVMAFHVLAPDVQRYLKMRNM